MSSAHSAAAILLAVDYTVILAAGVTGLTAVLVGVIGFLSTRMTAKVAERQAAEETARLKAQQEEARREHRQALYHDLLNHDRSFFNLTDPDRGQIGLDAFDAWQKRLNELVTGVMLFGTDSTARASANLLQIVSRVADDARQTDEQPFEDSLSQAFEADKEKWRQARRDLLDDMRADVSADARPVDWKGLG